MYKLTKYHHLTIIISILLICYLIIPMTPLDTISYLRYDTRWWYNQYIEFKQSFPNINPVAFTGFNNSGLIINQFYPNNTLRLLEIPMILFNVESPQLVIGILTLMTSILSSIGIYLNVKALEIKHTIFHTAVFTTILLSAQNSGPLNSVTQNLGIAIMLFAVYGIYSRKYWIVTISTIALLNTSLSTSIIAAISMFVIQAVVAKNKKDWLHFICAGVVGVIITSPILFPILEHIHDVAKPTTLFLTDKTVSTIFEYLIATPSKTGTFITQLNNFAISGSIFLIIVLAKRKIGIDKKENALLITIGTMAMLQLFPKLNGTLMTPIQPGTWSRTWPLLIIIIIYMISRIKTEKYVYAFGTIAIITMIISISFLMPKSLDDKDSFQINKQTIRYQTNDVASYLQTCMFGVDTNKKNYQYINDSISKVSTDYIPKNATI